VATSEGVFYLKEVKNYAEAEVLVNSEIKPGKPDREVLRDKPELVRIKEPQRTRKGIFLQIFGKKNEPDTPRTEQVSHPLQEQQRSIITAPEIRLPEPKYFRKVTGRLKSVNYLYKKVDGLNEKCKQMIPSGNGILASTNKGLFVISGHKAKAIVENAYINSISTRSKDNKYYVALSTGYLYVTPGPDDKWITGYPDPEFSHPVFSIISADENTLWAGGDDVAYKVTFKSGISSGTPKVYKIRSDSPQRYVIEYVNDTVFLFTLSSINYYSRELDTFIEYKNGFSGNSSPLKFVFTQPEIPWIKTENEWIDIGSSHRIELNDKALLKLFDDLSSIYTDRKNLWVVTGDNMLYRIVRNKLPTFKPEVGLFIRSISDGNGSFFKLSDIVFKSGINTVYIDPVAPGYLKQNSTQYQYFVEKEMTDWTKWQYNNKITMVIKPGRFTLHVRARDIWGNISEPKLVRFTIEAPFTKTTFFYILVIVAGIIVIIGIISFRERQLKKDKRILESRVKERTAQIEAQKHEITSSIEYASRIQMAMLPENEHLREFFSEYFIIFKPREIVSGDFYWIGEDEKNIYFTVADCTGHGVPGAFMSTLGISTLDEILTNNKKLKANTVLNILREKIKTSLHQTGKLGEAADGMDLAFCILDKNCKKLQFSGAYNSLLIFQGGEPHEYRADRMPIGIYYGEKESFTNYEINVQKGDVIYLFTDGFADQFGGPRGTKYMKYNLKRLLSEIYDKPMDEQQIILENEFEKWKGSLSQIDDVTIMGVRI
jgi:serine phosphatase RsbU (regulator of sigma subunit)